MIPCFLILDPVLFAYHVRVPLSQNFQRLKQLQHLYLGACVLHWPVPDLHSLSATPAWGTQRQVLWWDVLMPEPWECGLKYYLVFVENLKIVSLMVVWLVRRLVHNRKPLISWYSRTALLELKNLTIERKYNSGEKMSEGTDSGILLSALTQLKSHSSKNWNAYSNRDVCQVIVEGRFYLQKKKQGPEYAGSILPPVWNEAEKRVSIATQLPDRWFSGNSMWYI